MELRYAWNTMSSKYRLRFCKPVDDLGYSAMLKPWRATVRTLVGQGFLLPVIRSLFALGAGLFNRIPQIEHFCTKVDRVVHLVLDRWTFPDHSKNV